eukprot:5885762-Prymnesium_polylepis.1
MMSLATMNITDIAVASVHICGTNPMKQQEAEDVASPREIIVRTPTRSVWKPTIGEKMQDARLSIAMITPTMVELRPRSAATSGKNGERNATSMYCEKMQARQTPRKMLLCRAIGSSGRSACASIGPRGRGAGERASAAIGPRRFHIGCDDLTHPRFPFSYFVQQVGGFCSRSIGPSSCSTVGCALSSTASSAISFF